jgi:hypothetical protein
MAGPRNRTVPVLLSVAIISAKTGTSLPVVRIRSGLQPGTQMLVVTAEGCAKLLPLFRLVTLRKVSPNQDCRTALASATLVNLEWVKAR